MKIASKIAVAAFGAFAAMGLFTSCGDDGKTLYLYNWTYYTPDEVLRDFEKEFNCKVKVDSYASNEEMYAKLKAGAKGYDIVVPSQDYASIMIAQGMLQKLDPSKQTNNSKINPLLSKMATYDPNFEYASPYYLGAAGVSVNKTKVQAGTYEKNWNIFADKKFAGHATMMDDMREVIGDALTVLGYDINTTDDGELAKAKELIVILFGYIANVFRSEFRDPLDKEPSVFKTCKRVVMFIKNYPMKEKEYVVHKACSYTLIELFDLCCCEKKEQEVFEIFIGQFIEVVEVGRNLYARDAACVYVNDFIFHLANKQNGNVANVTSIKLITSMIMSANFITIICIKSCNYSFNIVFNPICF